MALQPILASLKTNHPSSGLELVFSYLDDCVLAGNAQEVAAAFAELREAPSRIGLKVALGRDRSLLVFCARKHATFDPATLPPSIAHW